jgi:hypothetical protein
MGGYFIVFLWIAYRGSTPEASLACVTISQSWWFFPIEKA